MPVSWERRHLPDILAYHNHGGNSGGGGTFTPIVDNMLLESDPGTETDLVLLESDLGAGTDVILLESST